MTCHTPSDLDQLAPSKLGALYELSDALALAEGLTELLGDHCEWSAMPNVYETPCPRQIFAAARLIQQQIALARTLADSLIGAKEEQS